MGALIGLLIERSVLKRLYGYPEALKLLIATYALFLILVDPDQDGVNRPVASMPHSRAMAPGRDAIRRPAIPRL